MQLSKHLQAGATLFVVALIIGYFVGVYVPFTALSNSTSPQALSGLNVVWNTAINGELKEADSASVVVDVNGKVVSVAFNEDTVLKKMVVGEQGVQSEQTITAADLTAGAQVGLLISVDSEGHMSAQEIDVLIPAAQ